MQEDGWLTLPDAPPLRAGRALLWRQTGQGVSVFFADGRPFHDFDPDLVRPSAVHLCPPDRYEVRYDFTGLPVWSMDWHVTGPRKGYVMRTVFARRQADLARAAVSGQVFGNQPEDCEWLSE